MYCAGENHADLSGCADFQAQHVAKREPDIFKEIQTSTTTTALSGSCCKQATAECLACAAGLQINDFCAQHLDANVTGCTRTCGQVEDNYNYPGGDLYFTDKVPSAEACCA